MLQNAGYVSQPNANLFFNSTEFMFEPVYAFKQILNMPVPAINPNGLFTDLDDDGIYN